MHAINPTILEGYMDILASDGVADSIERSSPGWVCEAEGCHFGSWSLKEGIEHVVANQFTVKPEPLTKARKETRNANQYSRR